MTTLTESSGEQFYASDAPFSEVPGYIDEATEYPPEGETDTSASESEISPEDLEDMTEKMVKYVRKHLRRLVGEHLHANQVTNDRVHPVAMDKAIGAGLEFAHFECAIGGPQVENNSELSGVRTVTITTNGEVFVNAFTDKTVIHEDPGLKTRAYLTSCNATIGLGNDAEYVATHGPLLNSQRMTPEQLNALCILLLELVSTVDYPVTIDTNGNGTLATVTQWGQRLVGNPQMPPGNYSADRATLPIAA